MASTVVAAEHQQQLGATKDNVEMESDHKTPVEVDSGAKSAQEEEGEEEGVPSPSAATTSGTTSPPTSLPAPPASPTRSTSPTPSPARPGRTLASPAKRRRERRRRRHRSKSNASAASNATATDDAAAAASTEDGDGDGNGRNSGGGSGTGGGGGGGIVGSGEIQELLEAFLESRPSRELLLEANILLDMDAVAARRRRSEAHLEKLLRARLQGLTLSGAKLSAGRAGATARPPRGGKRGRGTARAAGSGGNATGSGTGTGTGTGSGAGAGAGAGADGIPPPPAPHRGRRSTHPSLAAVQRSLQHHFQRDALSRSLRKRLTVDELRQRNILHGSNDNRRDVAQQRKILERLLQERPSRSKLKQSHVIQDVTMWSTIDGLEPRPDPRHGHTCTLAGRRLYLIGGVGTSANTMKPAVFDVDKSQWLYLHMSGRVPLERYGHTATLAGTTVYVFAGYHKGTFLRDLVPLDTEHQAWREPVAPLEGVCPSGRASHTCVTIGNHLVLFGGNDASTIFNDLWLFHTGIGQWEQPVVAGTPPHRAAHSAAVHKQRMYVFGGASGVGTLFDDLHVYDKGGAVWYRPAFTGTPPSARCGHTAAFVGTNMLVVGGNNNERSFNDLFVLDVAPSQAGATAPLVWSTPPQAGVVPPPRSNHSCVAVGACLVIFGGTGTEAGQFTTLGDLLVLETGVDMYATPSSSSSLASSSSSSSSTFAAYLSTTGTMAGDTACTAASAATSAATTNSNTTTDASTAAAANNSNKSVTWADKVAAPSSSRAKKLPSPAGGAGGGAGAGAAKATAGDGKPAAPSTRPRPSASARTRRPKGHTNKSVLARSLDDSLEAAMPVLGRSRRAAGAGGDADAQVLAGAAGPAVLLEALRDLEDSVNTQAQAEAEAWQRFMAEAEATRARHDVAMAVVKQKIARLADLVYAVTEAQQ